MSTQGGGPPNKWIAFSTLGMKTPSDFSQALSNAWAQGYTGVPVSIPSPAFGGGTWVALSGYAEPKGKS